MSTVKNDGGTLSKLSTEADFVEGGCGKGFISSKNGQVITFPVKGKNLKNLKSGTVELCITLTKDLKDLAESANDSEDSSVSDELFLFMAYERDHDAIILQLFDPGDPDKDPRPPVRSVARMRIKRGKDSDPKWVDANSEELHWKKGEHHHLAGTWGKDGVKLYIDGQLAAHNPTEPTRPTKRPESFAVNNDSVVDKPPKNPTHCIVRNLRISNYPKSDAEVMESYKALHSNE